MSTREDVDRFLTDEGRVLVDQFVAETAAEADNNVDMNEVVRQNLADHKAALTGKQPTAKPARPARPKNPKPTVGYITVSRDWNPSGSHDRTFLWNPHATQKAAEADRALSDSLGCGPQMIVRVDTTFTIVDGGPKPEDAP